MCERVRERERERERDSGWSANVGRPTLAGRLALASLVLETVSESVVHGFLISAYCSFISPCPLVRKHARAAARGPIRHFNHEHVRAFTKIRTLYSKRH